MRKDLENNVQEKEVVDIALEGGNGDEASEAEKMANRRRWGALQQAVSNLAYTITGLSMLGGSMTQFLIVSMLDIRVMVFASGAIALNAFGFFVFMSIFVTKAVWMDTTLNPFFCVAFTYFGIFGAVALWANPLF